ncbi:hypothetical protein QFZ34_001176 [Phyllobacterium ifriqiyense]|uniref:Uncharacterized protein n=1 Tax=Phyllobacterium ifriqiyense TaxID=314238 RepID=A0ABU0S5I1_9HYPH|nr:hypothetical protein [Phyllobacterium ifriqiyense]
MITGGLRSIEVQGPGTDERLVPGAAIGSVSRDTLKRLMIRRTIKQHLDKEIRFAAVKHHPTHWYLLLIGIS